MTVLSAVRAVQIVKGLQTGDAGFIVQSLFTMNDTWKYHAVSDDRLCSLCMSFADMTFLGHEIRQLFPYLMIRDKDTISVHNHMPRDSHCRCELRREGS